MWQRGPAFWGSVLVGVLVLGALGSAYAEGDEDPVLVSSCHTSQGTLSSPYATKNGGQGVYPFTPTVDAAGLVYLQDLVYEEGDYRLTFLGSYTTVGAQRVPDFDVLFDRGSLDSYYHNANGDDEGTVPKGTVGIYIYMPVGPDTTTVGLSDGKVEGAQFAFEQCPKVP